MKNPFSIRSDMGIRKRILLLILLAFLPLLLLQGFTYYMWFEERKEAEMQSNLELARTVAKTFDTFVRNVFATQLAIGNAATSTPAPSTSSLRRILVQAGNENMAFREFAWISREGEVLVSGNPASEKKDLSGFEFYKTISDGRRWVVGDTYASPETGDTFFSISRGIRDETGTLLGIVSAVISADRLDDVMAVERARDAGINLIDSKGMHAYCYPATTYSTEQRNWVRAFPVLRDVLNGKEVVTTVVSERTGKNRVIGFVPIASVGWIAAAGRAEDDLIRAVTSNILPHAMMIFVVTLAALGAALAFSRPISTSIVRLRNRATALGRGETQYLDGTSGPGELKDLTDAFNEMAEKVRVREAELMQKEAELEQRVRNRTEELQKAYESLMEETKEREHLERRLRQGQKMEALGTMAGGIAHDFNNMLAAIIGFTELTLDNIPEESPDRQQLRQVLRASMRGRDLVKQMLTFSRKSEQERTRFKLSSAIDETAKLLRASIPSTIDMRIEVKSESAMVFADAVGIQQVVMNLCNNAADAMREKGGVIAIEVMDFIAGPGEVPELLPGPYLRLSVSDTGTGISADVIDRIFDPFFTTKEINEGTGLGLSVVHGIVKSYQGAITVESTPGKGSAFRIYLPAVHAITPEDGEAEAPLPGGKEKILFVDDEEVLVEMASSMIQRFGYTVTGAKSSSEALRFFKEDPNRFDLIITDQTMPGMTGLQLSKELKQIRNDIPIILTTGFSRLVTAESIKAAGISAFIMKPLSREELARTIRETLDHKTP
jgi:signal transduction histidine kinase/CheY-like chemotaxis protein